MKNVNPYMNNHKAFFEGGYNRIVFDLNKQKEVEKLDNLIEVFKENKFGFTVEYK